MCAFVIFLAYIGINNNLNVIKMKIKEEKVIVFSKDLRVRDVLNPIVQEVLSDVVAHGGPRYGRDDGPRILTSHFGTRAYTPLQVSTQKQHTDLNYHERFFF